ncbi:MAG: hypothetical protein GX100_02100 [candidate division WS1 bacterium]|nr:hypothetical protein [candidate division WS1 bacterium]
MPTSTQEISNAEMASMCRQFANLMSAQVNVLEIFEALREGTDNAFMREVLYSVQESVEMGRSLATAFSRYPQTFSPFFISMLRQGELEGELDRVLEELAEHYESRMQSEVDIHRRPEAGAFDLETVASVFQWIFIWLVALVAVAALGAGAIFYATGPKMLPGEALPNILLLVGTILLLGVVVFSLGRQRSARAARRKKG